MDEHIAWTNYHTKDGYLVGACSDIVARGDLAALVLGFEVARYAQLVLLHVLPHYGFGFYN